MRGTRQRGRDSGPPLGPSEASVLLSGSELNGNEAAGLNDTKRERERESDESCGPQHNAAAAKPRKLAGEALINI